MVLASILGQATHGNPGPAISIMSSTGGPGANCGHGEAHDGQENSQVDYRTLAPHSVQLTGRGVVVKDPGRILGTRATRDG